MEIDVDFEARIVNWRMGDVEIALFVGAFHAEFDRRVDCRYSFDQTKTMFSAFY